MGLRALDICMRLLMACLFAGIIGWEREFNSRPAGLRTHILVCVGSTIIAMIQVQMVCDTISMAQEAVRADPARLIAQVISGIGFLGAGTIVVTKSSIRGLTTAASLWATAGLGIAIGMGYYDIALVSSVVIIVVLTLVKRIVHLPTMKKIEIEYRHHEETKDFINRYFTDRSIKVRDVNFSIRLGSEGRIYVNNYTIELPKGLTYSDIAEELAEQKTITQIHLMSL